MIAFHFYDGNVFQRRILITQLCIVFTFQCFGLKTDERIVAAEEIPPYEMQKYVSTSDDNIEPDIVQGLKGFQKGGEGTLEYVNVDGTECIQMVPKSQFKFSFAVNSQKLYLVAFNFRFSAGTEFDYSENYPGLSGWVSIRDEKGQAANSWRILEQRNLTSPMRYVTSLYSTDLGEELLFSLQFNATRGYCLISDIQVRVAQVSAEDNLQLIQPHSGKPGKSFLEVRPYTSQMGTVKTPPLAPERVWIVNGEAIVFHRTDPDKLFFYSSPVKEETGKIIRAKLSPGEISVFTVAVQPYRALSNLTLVQPILRDQSGKTFPGIFEWSVVRYHPRRVDYYGRGQTWQWVADHFYDADGGISAEANRTHSFWVKVMSAPDTPAGLYTGNIPVRAAEGLVGDVPIEIVVRPFKLVEPTDKTRGIYTDNGRWDAFTDAQILMELEDFKSHGINTLLIPSGRPIANAREITGWGLDKRAERHLALISKAKMDGPFVAWFGWLDSWLAEHFNLPVSDLQKDPSLWPETVKKAYKRCLELFKFEFEKRGFKNVLFHAVDEPGYWKKGSPEQFIWKYGTAREVGLGTYSTSSYLPDDLLGKNLTHHCYGKGALINSERAAFVRKKTLEADQKFWWYGIGSYSGQIGNMVRNRYLSGFLFYKSLADGLMIWTFQRPVGNPFDDFYASATAQPCITYPKPDRPGENLDTPHWEGIRQGWIDYRYAATLAELAKTSAGARADLYRILGSMPWNGDPFVDDQVTNYKCDTWRDEIAAAIERHMQ